MEKKNLDRNLKEKKIYVKKFEKKKRKKEKVAGCTFWNPEVYSLSCNSPFGALEVTLAKFRPVRVFKLQI